MMLIDRKIKARKGKVNEASMVEDIIWFNREEANKNEYGFIRNLRERHYYDARPQDIRIFTLLHEVGHIKTKDFTVENENDKMNRALCALTPKGVAEKDKEIQDLYYALPLEWEATEWAIDWFVRHPIKRKIIERIL